MKLITRLSARVKKKTALKSNRVVKLSGKSTFKMFQKLILHYNKEPTADSVFTADALLSGCCASLRRHLQKLSSYPLTYRLRKSAT